jgi:hypothetical protein
MCIGSFVRGFANVLHDRDAVILLDDFNIAEPSFPGVSRLQHVLSPSSAIVLASSSLTNRSVQTSPISPLSNVIRIQQNRHTFLACWVSNSGMGRGFQERCEWPRARQGVC